MKKIITLLVALLMAIASFAQGRGINYKAVIKDDNGNVLANQNLKVKFSILDSSDNMDYSETHTTITDANGIVILIIGSGTENVTGDYFSINWPSDLYKLKVEIDPEPYGVFINMGTSNFEAVPYAYNSMDNLWQLNGDNAIAIGEKVGIGESNPTAKLDVNGNLILQLGAAVNEFSIDGTFTGNSNNAVPTENAVKTYVDNGTIFKTTSGITSNSGGTIVTDDFVFGSTQLNYNGQTNRFYFDKSKGAFRAGFANSTQWDSGNVGDYSTAFGFVTVASGARSTALGSGTIASRFASTAIGNYNADDQNALFMVGNGTGNGNRNSALVVKDNGDTVLDGELHTTNTGSSNMLPIAYGIVGIDGSIINGTGNFTVIFDISPPTYRISIDGKILTSSNTVVSVTPWWIRSVGAWVKGITNTYIEIKFDNTLDPDPDASSASAFHFIVYQL